MILLMQREGSTARMIVIQLIYDVDLWAWEQDKRPKDVQLNISNGFGKGG